MNQKIGLGLLATLITGVLGAGGCGAGSGPHESSAREESTVTRTVVHLRGDLPPIVLVEDISAEEAAAEVATREARNVLPEATSAAPLPPAAPGLASGLGEATEAITQDTACAGASLWINDGTQQTGNRICFYGSGQVNLGAYCRLHKGSVCISSWAGEARSYWAGSDPSGFFNHYTTAPPTGTPDCGEFFLSDFRMDWALACAQSANYVSLGSNPWQETFGAPVVVPASNRNPPSIYLAVPNAPGGEVNLRPGSAPLTVHVGLTDSFTLTAVADDPGGVQSVSMAIPGGDIDVACQSGNVGQLRYYYTVPPPFVATGGTGSQGYTRQINVWNVDISDYTCEPGYTVASLTFGVTAQASNYSGVTSGTTASVVFEYP